jgi:hypothetical protein
MPDAASNDPFQLIALTPMAVGRPGGWRDLGRYPDLESALRARVDDVLAQLVNNDGWLITAEHLLIGPGPDGRNVVAGHVTELGADPASDRVPDPYDELATRRWLLAAYRLPA